ncbi:Beta-lactamase [Fusarium albosuccineum]|uniref:Beta-lactamase n=1 Tax=Fusarium albosuccineum TaxID=1237068 RepID=A0A8H4PBU8_9HYPO|nr:Beta-lactamase [Fusarium albosuccineum]
MAPFNPDDLSRFDDFQILETTYKIVSGHEIACHVLVSKRLVERARPSPTEPRPIIFRFHGGGFIAASSLFPDFFQPWVLQLASLHDAIIVSCDYRLAPEATLDEIIEDVDDCFRWIQDKLPSFISAETNINADTTRILTAGDSAGGYLSLLFGLNHASDVRAVTAAYPVIDIKSAHFVGSHEKPMMGFPHLPISLVHEHEAKVKSGEIPPITSSDPRCARIGLMFSFVQNAKYDEFFPSDRRDLNILEKVDDGARFPRGGVFICHGKSDSLVPVEGSVKLLEKVREIDPELPFTLSIQEGEHGFDATASIEDQWMHDGLKGLVSAWLA